MSESKTRGAAADEARRGGQPGVLTLNIRDRTALYAAYMPFVQGGGIFIPTSRKYELGEEVFMILSLPQDQNRIAVEGKVVWITPEGLAGPTHAGRWGPVPARRQRRRRACNDRVDSG